MWCDADWIDPLRIFQKRSSNMACPVGQGVKWSVVAQVKCKCTPIILFSHHLQPHIKVNVIDSIRSNASALPVIGCASDEHRTCLHCYWLPLFKGLQRHDLLFMMSPCSAAHSNRLAPVFISVLCSVTPGQLWLAQPRHPLCQLILLKCSLTSDWVYMILLLQINTLTNVASVKCSCLMRGPASLSFFNILAFGVDQAAAIFQDRWFISGHRVRWQEGAICFVLWSDAGQGACISFSLLCQCLEMASVVKLSQKMNARCLCMSQCKLWCSWIWLIILTSP